MGASTSKMLTNKIIVTGWKVFWQSQLQHVFEKEGWTYLDLPEDYPDPQALLQVHNNPVILYVLPGQCNPAKGTWPVQQLVELLRISQEQSVQAFYLVSTLSTIAPDDQSAGKAQAALLAERIVQAWSELSGIPVGILRLPDVYGPSDYQGESLLDCWLLAIERKYPVSALPENCTGTRYFLYADDAVYGIYRAVSRRYQGGIVDFIPEEGLSAAGFQQLIQQLTGTQPDFLPADTASVYAQAEGSLQTACDELGWRLKYDLTAGGQLAWEGLQAAAHARSRQEQQSSVWSVWKSRLHRGVPYLENIAGALLMLGIAYFQGGSTVNSVIYLDLNFVYIGTMGLLYGKHQALLAMLLSAILLLSCLVKQGGNLVGMIYQPEVLLHLVSYLFAAILTGYFADSRLYEREAVLWHKRQTDERYRFLREIYEETLSVKDRLYRQILNADDSIGRLYRIIRKLDSVELENIFTQAAVVTAQVLNVDNIAVYVGTDQYYLRQKVRLGSLAEQQPRSLRVEDYPYLQQVLHEKTIYVNRELVTSAPDLAAPIIYQGQVIAVVEIFGMHFSQWNLSQQNLLSITTRLIASSMGRAYQYEAEIQSRRYYDGTRIMQEKEFGKIIEELRLRQELQHELPIAVLEVDMTNMDYPTLDERLTGVIRSEDFLGNWQGRIYILLPDADEKVAAMIQQRMERAGIRTTASEDIL